MATERTVQQAINTAFHKLGMYKIGEALPAEDNADARRCLQDMLAEWASNQLLIPFSTLESFALTAGTASYTIGETAADLDTVRPEQINSAFIRVDSTDYDMDIIGELAYNALALKATTGRPTHFFYNATVPDGTLKVWPTPDAANTLYFSSNKPQTEPTSLTADLMVDYGYPRAYHNIIVYNLAIELAPEYGKTPADSVVVKAEHGKRTLMGLNAARRHEAAVCELAYG